MTFDEWLTTQPEKKSYEQKEKEEVLKEEELERREEARLDLLMEDIYG